MDTYTFPIFTDLLRNVSTIQTVIDVDLLAAPIKTYLQSIATAEGLTTSQSIPLQWTNTPAAVYIDQASLKYYLPSLGNQTPAPEVRRSSPISERVAEMQRLNAQFPKCKILIWGRASSSSPWVWIDTEIIQNSGDRVNTLNLLPYLSQGSIDVLGKYTQVGIQFVSEALTRTTLPQVGDFLTFKASLRIELPTLQKKTTSFGKLKILTGISSGMDLPSVPYGASIGLYIDVPGALPGDLCYAEATGDWMETGIEIFSLRCSVPNANVVSVTAKNEMDSTFNSQAIVGMQFKAIVFQF